MPGLVRKLLIYAAVDGLILQPVTQRNQRQGTPIQIEYKTHAISPYLQDLSTHAPDATETFEVHGVIGLLNVSASAHLITIARRKQVAQLWNKPVYTITDVAIIPLASQHEAEQAIAKAIASSKRPQQSEHADQVSESADFVDDADNDTLASLEETWLDEEMTNSAQSPGFGRQERASGAEPRERGVAEDVIGRKGYYGRFADKWFSKKGWASGQRRNMGMSSNHDQGKLGSAAHSRRSSGSNSLRTSPAMTPQMAPSAAALDARLVKEEEEASHSEEQPVQKKDRSTTEALLPKLLQTTKLLLMSQTFYFSYDYDITYNLASQRQTSSDVPLHRQCDPQYFWNEHLLQPFIQGCHDDFVLPTMQGFIGQRAFTMAPDAPSQPPKETVVESSTADQASIEKLHDEAKASEHNDFLLTLISRRSIKRAGFRYLRRGIDEEGNVANNVETEQILSTPEWTDGLVQSFVQVRGSIPLFYSQTPYTFKPLPVLHASREANQRALKRHLSALVSRYGAVQAVSLIDKHGTEVAIGNAYESHMKSLNADGGINGQKIPFNWFEFHSACKGMKFENVSRLIDELEPYLASSKWASFTHTSSASNMLKQAQQQSGIVRTNCMDCLDRTNVVQSAIAQHILAQQLQNLVTSSSSQSRTPISATSTAFNALWADNGDAVSLSYAGTAALKGDFVRTRRRTPAGVLQDLSLTLSRYYRNLFDDFFAQAALDYLLGNVSVAIFTEFRERMVTADPAIDLGRARQSAVATAAAVVIADEEDLLHGWAVSSPAAPSKPLQGAAALRAQPFSDVLLLLADRALYVVQYDWDAEKARGYERFPLAALANVSWGTYVTETLAAGQVDPSRNAGVRIDVAPAPQGRPALSRVNTRTVGNADAPVAPASRAAGDARVLAFKALPLQSSILRTSMHADGGAAAAATTERELAAQIAGEICAAAERLRVGEGAEDVPGDERPVERLVVEERDVVSLEEARRSTTYVDSIGYGLKRLVWG